MGLIDLLQRGSLGMQGTASLTHRALGFMPLLLGTPCAPFGNKKAENTARLNLKGFSWLGAVDAVRRGQGNACRNQIKCGMSRRRTGMGETALSGIKIAELKKEHTLLWFQFPPSYHALILHKCPPSNGTEIGSEMPCQKSPAVQGFR